MAYICTRCWSEAFLSKKIAGYQCPDCGLEELIGERNFIIHADDLLVESLILLNRNGFRTKACCEGHWNTNHPDSWPRHPYIAFTKPYPDLFLYLRDRLSKYNCVIHGATNVSFHLFLKKNPAKSIVNNRRDFNKVKFALWEEFVEVLKEYLERVSNNLTPRIE